MNITYCEGWFQAEKRPARIITTEEARLAHESGKLYTVIIGDVCGPSCVVDVRLENKVVGVKFLDSHARVYLAYQFDELDDDRLFLSGVMNWRYCGESESAERVMIYKFFPDGRVLMREETNGGAAKDGRRRTTVDANWEKVPHFGDYAGVSRKDRVVEPPTE